MGFCIYIYSQWINEKYKEIHSSNSYVFLSMDIIKYKYAFINILNFIK